ncbi:MAG: methyltransferase [Patescibacteria group bacterium]
MQKLKIEKLVFGGKALAREQGKVYFVEGALPGESVDVTITKEGKSFAEAKVVKVLKPSKFRVEPREDHYRSCSPWQILDFSEENKIKCQIVFETFQRFAKIDLPELQIETDAKEYNYRNKIEFNFIVDEEKLSYAIFAPGTNDLTKVYSCALASLEINKAADLFLDVLNKTKIPKNIFKKIIFRGNSEGQVLVAVFVREKTGLEKFKLPKCVSGVIFYQDDEFETKKIFNVGVNALTEDLNNTILKFGVNSFFQINVPIFQKVLNDIAEFLTTKDVVVDFYSGVGAIALSLADKFKSAELVEINSEAVDFARENIEKNSLDNCKMEKSTAESAKNKIDGKKVLIVDPPRQGLDKEIVDKILKELPPKIIYLSCDQSTQARDFNLLKEKYEIKFAKLYNFFPHTPHIESLLVLQKLN